MIPYVAIRIDENVGLYSNQNGEFDLTSQMNDSIFLSALGYKTKKVLLKSIRNNYIYLSPSSFHLKEILISTNKNKNKNKIKIKKIKPIKHNDFFESHSLLIGEELAMFIPNNYNNCNIEIRSLSIPVVTKTISFDDNFLGKSQPLKKLKFSTLYKISFYKNYGGIPGRELYNENITLIINEKYKVVKLNLSKYNIELPSEGIFVSILNLGITNKQGSLVATKPYKPKKVGNKMVKIIKRTKPFFPLTFRVNSTNTYTRFSFNNDLVWKPFFKYNIVKTGEFHNISLGYELIMY